MLSGSQKRDKAIRQKEAKAEKEKGALDKYFNRTPHKMHKKF